MKRREAKALGLKTYNNGKPCPRGHIGERRTDSGVCVICRNEKKRLKAWLKRDDIKDEHKIISRDDARFLGLIYYYTAKACKRGHHSVRYVSTGICKECNRLHAAKIRNENPAYAVEYRKIYQPTLAKRKRNDPHYAMSLCMREMLRRVRRLTGLKKARRTEEILGYGKEELIKHLERLFEPGMSWSNHGAWHIDHIIPVSVMIKRGITDPRIINALDNLQPLWALDNQRKSAKVGKE